MSPPLRPGSRTLLAPESLLASAQRPSLPSSRCTPECCEEHDLAFFFFTSAFQACSLQDYSLVLPGLEFYVIQITLYAILIFII